MPERVCLLFIWNLIKGFGVCTGRLWEGIRSYCICTSPYLVHMITLVVILYENIFWTYILNYLTKFTCFMLFSDVLGHFQWILEGFDNKCEDSGVLSQISTHKEVISSLQLNISQVRSSGRGMSWELNVGSWLVEPDFFVKPWPLRNLRVDSWKGYPSEEFELTANT